MTDTTDNGPVTRRDLVEGRIDKVLTDRTGGVPVAGGMGGLQLTDMLKVAEAAKLMSTAGPMLPGWLQGNVGGCWAIIIRAMELGISPLTLANWTYLPPAKQGREQRIAYESQYYHAIIEARAPIKDRLQWRIEGTGDARKCFVWATFKGETTPRTFPPENSGDEFTLGKLRPALNDYGGVKGSPLWLTKPEQQLFYAMSRDWARVYCPDILGGVYAAADMDEEPAAASPRDVSPRLHERLKGPAGEGFQTAKSLDAVIDGARTVDSKKAAKDAVPAQMVDKALTSEPDPDGGPSGSSEPVAAASSPAATDAPRRMRGFSKDAANAALIIDEDGEVLKSREPHP